MNKTIPVKTVTAYAQTAAELRRLERLKKKLRERILKLTKQGFVPSELGPYLLLITTTLKAEINWRFKWFNLLKKQVGKKQAEKELNRVWHRAKKTKVTNILPRVNPAYKK